MPSKNAFGNNIRTRRKHCCRTQSWLARKIGMRGAHSKSYISRVEHGHVMPGGATLMRLARALDTTIDRLLK